jgi:hypothetical protein
MRSNSLTILLSSLKAKIASSVPKVSAFRSPQPDQAAQITSHLMIPVRWESLPHRGNRLAANPRLKSLIHSENIFPLRLNCQLLHGNLKQLI